MSEFVTNMLGNLSFFCLGWRNNSSTSTEIKPVTALILPVNYPPDAHYKTAVNLVTMLQGEIDQTRTV